ncbi:hypothetical protein OIU83_15470 [Flavobacterium sp. LS1R49]|uniref:Uncharacterized protein n=1 Tax=Flavobacterium shii TaxID=2987687 RepID=A0A9X2ZDG2_9FLAO|nr:hypothetical protein [Flavobacterium shii]MCV9929064.1 hypothetical protein [Flavobacterium shii]
MKTIHGITIIGLPEKPHMFCNHENRAVYIINGNDVTYKDPFGNFMSNMPRYIQINGKSFELNTIGEEIRLQDGTTMVLLPKEEIRHLANKTFYDDGQFKVIDFLTNTITEE